MLDHLALDGVWQDCEVELNQHHIRVYHLNPDLFRVDTTTANSYVEVLSELGLFQFGHSKDRPKPARPARRRSAAGDQSQIKVALATLDPLGMPVSCCGL